MTADSTATTRLRAVLTASEANPGLLPPGVGPDVHTVLSEHAAMTAELERQRIEHDALIAGYDKRGHEIAELRRSCNTRQTELEQLRTRLGEPQRKRSTTVWAIAWHRNGGTTYSFPIENERYVRDGFADLVRSGATGIRLVVSRDGIRWRDADGGVIQSSTPNGA